MSKRLALCCLLFASTVDSQSSNPKDDELCKTTIAKTDGSYTCRPIDQCPAVLRAAEDFAEYPKICRFDGRTPIVCCPDVPGAKAAEKCGEYYSSTTRGGGTIDFGGCPRRTEKSAENRRVSIVGGTEAVNSEFPHMVILGFGELVTDVHWSCGGSLISDRYVLSAAHCSEMGTKGPVKWTLLGDSDLGTDNGGADPQIREIVQRVLHPNYNPSSVYNDIGLYRLKTPVRFNRFVFPVCINADRQLVAEKAVAVGWGRTGSASPTSNVLRKVSLDFVDQNECNSSYSALTGKRLAFGINPNSQICAGNIGGGGKDTCQGDSGGPLLTVHPEFECLYTQVGITSFGKLCGDPDAPGVYTRVSNYVAWIESIVWPTPSSPLHN